MSLHKWLGFLHVRVARPRKSDFNGSDSFIVKEIQTDPQEISNPYIFSELLCKFQLISTDSRPIRLFIPSSQLLMLLLYLAFLIIPQQVFKNLLGLRIPNLFILYLNTYPQAK